MKRAAAPVLALGALLVAATPVSAQQKLLPVQLLSGLHRIQDSIARGDRSALDLQPDMVSLVDDSFRAQFSQKGRLDEDIRPLLVFALGGGGATAASRMLEHVPPDHPHSGIAYATLAYIAGDADKAAKLLADVEVMELDIPLAAYVALAKGTVNVARDKKEAVRSFDHARLLAPGTLIEEVALRRLLSIHLSLGDAGAFSLTAQQYAHRYIDSPFAAQFVKLYVPGIVTLDASVSRQDILNLLSALSHDQRIAILMRLTRSAAIAGRLDLSAFAAGELSRGAADDSKISRARLRLYENLAAVASPDAHEALMQLSRIDERDLPVEDRPLLHAALSLAGAVVGPIGTGPSPAPPEREQERVAGKPAAGERSSTVGVDAKPDWAPVEAASASRGGSGEADALEATFDGLLSSARAKLKSIDELIEE